MVKLTNIDQGTSKTRPKSIISTSFFSLEVMNVIFKKIDGFWMENADASKIRRPPRLDLYLLLIGLCWCIFAPSFILLA